MAFEDWEKLLYGIQEGECILFVGPELPLVPAEGERVLPLTDLGRRLRGKLGEEGGDGRQAAAAVARLAQRFLAAEDELGLEIEIKRWYGDLAERRSLLHEVLAALPFRRIVTSSHDLLMANALEAAGKRPDVQRYHYRGANHELLPEPSVEKPTLFHLYGHVPEPESLVLAETQLIDFLTALSSKNPPLPNDLNEALTNGRFFLFLGFGLGQWYLRILLHVLKVLKKGSHSFAFEPLEAGAGEALGDTVLFYRDNYRVGVYQEDVAEFVSELARRYQPPAGEEDAAARSEGPARIAAGAPTVFICHASEDKSAAEKIHQELQRAGLRTWLDKDALRGGDRWDDRIEETIKKVDYVVIVNSRALDEKFRSRSYVNKEIKRALEAEEYRFTHFIIPARIDDTPLLPVLRDFQAVDLTAERGMRRLVRAIKRDLERT